MQHSQVYKAEYVKCMGAKLGLLTPQLGDYQLVTTLCDTMASTKADYTNVFRVLTDHDLTGRVLSKGGVLREQ